MLEGTAGLLVLLLSMLVWSYRDLHTSKSSKEEVATFKRAVAEDVGELKEDVKEIKEIVTNIRIGLAKSGK